MRNKPPKRFDSTPIFLQPGTAQQPIRPHAPDQYNAYCPNCLGDICMYRTPSGAIGAYNLWGPPWTPHPCSTGEFLRDITQIRLTLPPTRPSVTQLLIQARWTPLDCQRVTTLTAPAGISLLEGTCEGQAVRLYVRGTGLTHLAPWYLLTQQGQTHVSTLAESQGRVFALSDYAYPTLDTLLAAPTQDPPKVPRPKAQPEHHFPDLHQQWFSTEKAE
ncbi:MAG: hypothetical protein QM527_04065 [Alphaproteobacteria bacterium]|nr:hypothetical protein [Alphaproteobacteria bacterium]